MSSKNIELNRNIETLYNNLAGDAAEIPHLSIINPNSFVVRVHNENIRHQLKLEAEIQKLYEDKIENFAPTVGDVCGYYKDSVCLRVHVDKIEKYNGQMFYILWAIDHGYPISTERSNRFCFLPEKFKEPPSNVTRSSLNILPAKEIFNLDTQCCQYIQDSRWTKGAVDYFTRLVVNAAEIKVVPNKLTPDKIRIVDVFIKTHSGEIISIAKSLQLYKFAVPVVIEANLFNYLKNHPIERWNDNIGSGGVIKTARQIHRYDNFAKQKDEEQDSDIRQSIKKVEQWNDNFKSPTKSVHPKQPEDIDELPLIGKCLSDLSSIKNILMKPFEPLSSVVKKIESTSAKSSQHVPILPKVNQRRIQALLDMHKGRNKPSTSSSTQIPLNKKEMVSSSESYNNVTTQSSQKSNLTNIISKATFQTPVVNNQMSQIPKTQTDNKILQLQSRLIQRASEPVKETTSQTRSLNLIPAGASCDDSILEKLLMKPTKKLIASISWSPKQSSKLFEKSIEEKTIPNNPDNIIKENYTKNSYQKASENEAGILKNSNIHRVFVYGQENFEYIEQIQKVNFTPSIHKLMKAMKFEVFRTNSYSWQNILNGTSMMIITSRRNGKTLSFLPAVCSILYEYADTDKTEDESAVDLITRESTIGPVVIIVVKSNADGENMYKKCSKFTPLTKIVKGFRFHKSTIPEQIANTKVALLNSCDLLITTPSWFARLTSSETKTVDKSRLKHLIIDDLDSIVQRSNLEILHLLKVCCSSKPENNPQIVVTSNIWMPLIQEIRLLLPTSLVCIANYIEAAVFAKCSFILKKVDTVNEKMQCLISYIKDKYSTQKTLIIASDAEDVTRITNQLKLAKIKYLAIDGDETLKFKSIKINWMNEESGKMTALVCTDEIFKDFLFMNVQHLVHYTLPEIWTAFGFRFSSCFEFFMKNVKNNEQNSSSLILLYNENNQTNRELPRLIEFLKSHKLAKISSEIDELVQHILREKELSNLEDFVPFCDKILNFGTCLNNLECVYRHIFTDWDLPGDHIPKDGRIKFKVIQVRSAKQISVKILEKCAVGSTNWISACDAAYISLFIEMTNHFNNQDNHYKYEPIKLNDLCAISTDIDIHEKSVKYHRCRILQKVGPKTPAGTPNDSIVVIRLIDQGTVMNVKSSELINLPNKFKAPPAQAVDIFLHDVVPVDFEQIWDETSANELTQVIEKYQKLPNCSFSCRVDLALADMIMTSTIEVNEQLKMVGTDVCMHSLKKFLVKNDFVMLDPQVLKNLLELTKNCKILNHTNLNVINPSKSLEQDLVNNKNPQHEIKHSEIQEAQLPVIVPKEKWVYVNPDKVYRVAIGEFSRPNSFFVQLADDNHKWNRFVKKLDDHMPNKIPLENPKPGVICLMNTEAGLERVKLLDVFGEKCTIFNLDNGYTANADMNVLYEISSDLMTYIPFQAIHCKLTGIQPYNSEYWTAEAADEMFNRIAAVDSLYMTVVSRQETRDNLHELMHCDSYDVLLIDCLSDPPVKLNQVFIEESLADEDKKTSMYLDEDWEDDLETSHNNYIQINDKQNKNDSLLLEGFDVDVDMEELLGMYKLPSVVLPDALPKMIESKPQESVVHTPKTIQPSKVCRAESLDSDDDSDDETLPPALVSSNKHPKINWQQTDVMIRLTVHAVDCLDYAFEVNYETMAIVIKYEWGFETCTLHFFGGIDPAMTSHKLEGLNVVIRLKKLVCSTHHWPRLLLETDRNIFIKNDYSNIIFEEVQEEYVSCNVKHPSHESSDCDDSEIDEVKEHED